MFYTFQILEETEIAMSFAQVISFFTLKYTRSNSKLNMATTATLAAKYPFISYFRNSEKMINMAWKYKFLNGWKWIFWDEFLSHIRIENN